MTDLHEQFWAGFCRKGGILPASPHRVRRLGDDPAICRLILDLVRAGEKTGTFALADDFGAAGETFPAVGEYFVLTDFGGEPDCVVRLTEVKAKPFAQVTTDDIACEGPGLRDLAAWRGLHWSYWGRKLEALGRSPDTDMLVLCLRFDLQKE